MGYNLDRIRNALNKQTNGQNANKQDMQKLKYFKAGIGKYDLRFLPYLSSEGEPVQEVLYYEKLTEDGKRIVAPSTFGLPDPIRAIFDEKRREKGGWDIAKRLKPKKRFYAIVVDRKDEAAGPQLWEFSEELRDTLYATIVSKDNEDEYLFDPDKGYDWELNVSQATDTNGKPRVFNGNAVKKFVLNVRKRPSVLHKDPATAKKWLSEMPKLDEIFKRQCKTSEQLLEIMENFIARLEVESETTLASDTGTDHTASKGTSSNSSSVAAVATDEDDDKALDDAFSDM